METPIRLPPLLLKANLILKANLGLKTLMLKTLMLKTLGLKTLGLKTKPISRSRKELNVGHSAAIEMRGVVFTEAEATKRRFSFGAESIPQLVIA